MPRIPTFTASGSITPGPVASEADPAVFTRASRALGNVGGALAKVGDLASDVAEKKKLDEAVQFTDEDGSNFYQELTDFEIANKDKETFGDDFKEFATSKFQEVVSRAPSKLAAQRFSRRYRSHVDDRVRRALFAQESNRLQGGIDSAQKAVTSIMQSARADAGTDLEHAQTLFKPVYDDFLAGLDERYEDLAPKALQSMKEKAVGQFITGWTDIDPEFAQKLLNEQNVLDENQRATLQTRIDTARRGQDTLQAEVLSSTIEGEFSIASQNRTPIAARSRKEFDVFGNSADRQFFRYEQNRLTNNLAVKNYNNLKGHNAGAQGKLLKRMNESVGKTANPLEARRRQLATQQLFKWFAADQKLRQEDPVSWQQANQDEVGAAWAGANAEQDPILRAQKTQAAIQLSKFFQGSAPPDAPDSEKTKFLGKPDALIHVLTKGEAEGMAQKLKFGTPEERMALLAGWKQQYGPAFHDVYHDLITMPDDGIPQQTQLGLNMRNPTRQAAYFNAQVNEKVNTLLLDKDVRSDFDQAVLDNDVWKQLNSAMLGEFNARAKEFVGFKSGIMAYAASLMLDKEVDNPEDAVEVAIEHTIGRELGFTEVNGQTVAIAKDRADLPFGVEGPEAPDRTDGEIESLGRNMNLLLGKLSPGFIADKDPLGRDVFPNAPDPKTDPVGWTDFVHRALRSNGFFVSGKDGHTATLYMRGDDGQAFQLRDINGLPFLIDYDEVPEYMVTVLRLQPSAGAALSPLATTEEQRPERPGDTPPVIERGKKTSPAQNILNSAFGAGGLILRPFSTDTFKTNWPITSEAFINQRGGKVKEK